MNIPIFVFLIISIGLIAFYIYKPATVYFLFPIALLVFPTVRGFLGFPLYLFDVAGILILLHGIRLGVLGRWPRRSPPWHWIILVTLLFAGALVPMLRYGPNVQSIWITVHATVAFLQILTGVCLANQKLFHREANYLVTGIIISLAGLALIAWLQFGNPGFSQLYNSLFFRDTGRSLITSVFGAQIGASRAGGPFSSPNALSVVALLAGFTVWMIGNRRQALVAMLLAVAVIIPTVSRQAYVTLALAGALYLILGGPKTRVAGFLVLLATPLLGPLVSTFSAAASAIERFSRWRGGALEDSNITARLVAGPQRLWALIEQQPDVLLFGSGWDVTKLTAQGVDTGIYNTGFVSNAYLLWLYYGGVAGFLVIVTFMFSIARGAFRLRGEERSRAIAIVIPILFVYFSDNTGAIVEAMICFIALIGGFLLARAAATEQAAAQARRPRRLAPKSLTPVSSGGAS